MRYFELSNLFFISHLFVWAFALYCFWELHRSIGTVSHQAASLRAISESEVHKYAYLVEKFDLYFDFFSGCFILVGLIGTITGFFRALPHLSDAQYDFGDFRQALATSGFGIVWAITLNLILAAHHRFRIAPLMQSLHSKVSVDQLAQSLAESLERFGGQITLELRKGLTDFSAGAMNVAEATSRLARAADSISSTFSESTRQAADASAKIGQLLERITRLPEQTAQNLVKTYQDLTAFQSEALAEQKRNFERLAEANRNGLAGDVSALAAKYHETAEELVKEQVTMSRRNAEDFQKSLQQFQKDFGTRLLEDKTAIQSTLTAITHQIVNLVQDIQRSYITSFETSLAKLASGQTAAVEKLNVNTAHLSELVSKQSSNLGLIVESQEKQLAELRRLTLATQIQINKVITHHGSNTQENEAFTGDGRAELRKKAGLLSWLTRRSS